MKALFCALTILVTSTSALAYKDGTYNCKSADGSLPDRVVTITSSNIGGETAPYVKVTRSYREGTEVRNVEVRGFASVHRTDDSEALMVAALRLDFVNDELQNCRSK